LAFIVLINSIFRLILVVMALAVDAQQKSYLRLL